MAIFRTEKIKIGILQKGLCIVLLPLLINTILIVVMNNSLDRVSALMEDSGRQISAINTLSRDLVTTAGLLTAGNNAMMNGAYNFFHPFVTSCFETLEKDLDLAAAKLPSSMHFDDTRKQVLQNIEKQRAIFIKSKDKTFASDELVVKLRRANNWVTLCGKESDLLGATLENVQARFQQSVRSQEKERIYTEMIVGVALFLNFILACMLANYFNKHIARRIAALVKMARQLAAHQAISEKIEGQDELSDLAAEFSKVSDELNQMAEHRRTLMQMMAHDVRSPLMGAIVSVELLEVSKGASLSPEGTRSLDGAREAITVCMDLVNDLLLLESVENGELKPALELHDVRALVEDATTKVEEYAMQKSLQVKSNVEPDLVKLDYDQVLKIIERALLSAMERAPQRSTVSITSKKKGDSLLISLRDLGSTLDREAGEKLFDKFYQASAESDSRLPGLGLAIARPILNSLGGAIGFERSGEGNTLWLSLSPPTAQSIPPARGNG